MSITPILTLPTIEQDPTENNPPPKPKLENNPRPNRHDEILARFTELFSDLDSRLAESILKTVYVARDRLPEGYTEKIKGSDLFPHVILVDRQYFQIVTGHVGAGGNGAVVKGSVIPFDTAPQIEASPSKKAKTRVCKTSHNPQAPSFSPVKAVTQQIYSNMTPTKQNGFARFLATSHSLEGNPMALMPHYDGKNFAEAAFRDAAHLISSFSRLARVLSGLHTQNMVHRDFKPQNVMLTESGPVVVDPDGIKPTYTEAARTHGTPQYLNPRSFGFKGETLINQKKRQGLQRPCDDMYAFAITGLNTVLRHLSSQNNLHDTLQQLKPTYYTPNDGRKEFSKDALSRSGQKYGYRVFFLDKTKDQIKPERIGIYPTLKESLGLINTIFDKAVIPLSEKRVLEEFAKLCLKIQHDPANPRYNAKKVEDHCDLILAQEELDGMLEETNANEGFSTSTTRKRRLENGTPCPPFVGRLRLAETPLNLGPSIQ